jgi:hypothetical protein
MPEDFIIVLNIHHLRRAYLLGVGETACGARTLPRLSEYGEENGSQDRDDRNDNEQFNQGKTKLFISSHTFAP